MNTTALKIFKTLTKLETNFVRGVGHPSIPDLPDLGQVDGCLTWGHSFF